jgi:hypothetical protein
MRRAPRVDLHGSKLVWTDDSYVYFIGASGRRENVAACVIRAHSDFRNGSDA